MKTEALFVERAACEHFMEIQRQHLANLAHDVDPTQFKNIIAAGMYIISRCPGAVFYCHERDESPRIRRNGISTWMEGRDNAILFITHRDDLEWEDGFVEREASGDISDTFDPGQVMICSSLFQAAKIFERMSREQGSGPMPCGTGGRRGFQVQRLVSPPD